MNTGAKTTGENEAARLSPVRRLLMARGESVAAHAGMAVASVLLGVLALSAWWTLHTHRASVKQARLDQIRMAAKMLSQSAESMLAADDPSSLRRVVADAALSYGLTDCRVALPDGGVVADATGGKVGVLRLPEEWPLGKPIEHAETEQDQSIVITMPLEVVGRGGAVLEVEGEISIPFWAAWEVQAGLGGIGVMGLGAMLVVYRMMRRRLRGLGAIKDALHYVADGRRDVGLLQVSEAFGPEAAAWNTLLREHESLASRRSLENAAEALAARSTGGGELAAACDALWQGLIVLDASARVTYANGAACVLLATRKEQLVGGVLAQVLNDAKACETLANVATGKNRVRTSVEVQREGERPGEKTILRLSTRPMRRADGSAAIVVIEDVTQQRVADESRNAFVAQATHELRTPLTNIRLYVETLVDEGDANPQVRARCLNVISQEARRLERIVGDMLSVSEMEAGAMVLRQDDVRLEEIIEQLRVEFDAQAKDKDLGLVFELPPKYPVLRGDRDKLVLALHNLLGNALKYTPSGGTVTVRVAGDATVATIDVVDTGIGIKAEEHELIFERFYRAKDGRIEAITGSGLGLALAREIARLHGGDITLKSEMNKGSTFTLSVPIVASVAHAGEGRQAA